MVLVVGHMSAKKVLEDIYSNDDNNDPNEDQAD